MTPEEKKELFEKGKSFFMKKIAKPHVKRTKALADPSKFKINPFLDRYLARFYSGTDTSIAMAQTLILPRALGTSISGSFGVTMQKFCLEVILGGKGSTNDGIDLEFTDALDGRMKYYQLKSGPNTINKDDINTIFRHFTAIKNRAKANAVKDLGMNDLCVGVLYGTRAELSGMYKNLETEHHIPVYVGQEFWLRLTGDPNFYEELIQAFADWSTEVDERTLLDDVAKKLATAIEGRDQ